MLDANAFIRIKRNHVAGVRQDSADPVADGSIVEINAAVDVAPVLSSRRVRTDVVSNNGIVVAIVDKKTLVEAMQSESDCQMMQIDLSNDSALFI